MRQAMRWWRAIPWSDRGHRRDIPHADNFTSMGLDPSQDFEAELAILIP